METLMQQRIQCNISQELSFSMEEAEKNAWSDMYRAAPEQFARNLAILQKNAGPVLMISAALPTGLFNKVYIHGLNRGLDKHIISRIREFFQRNGADKYHILITPFTKPAKITELLKANGLKEVGETDKVFCEPLKTHSAVEIPGQWQTQKVDETNAEEWAAFICRTYGGLPNQSWLNALVGRKGWTHMILREKGEIVACRSIYIDGSKRGWLGIDAPVPGIMTERYDRDTALCSELVKLAREQNISLIGSCVELTDPSRSTDAYRYYYELGFQWAYTRKCYGL